MPAIALTPPAEDVALNLMLGGVVVTTSLVDAAALAVGIIFLAYVSTNLVFGFDGDLQVLTSSRRTSSSAGEASIPLVEAAHWRPLPSLDEISESCYCIADEGLCRWYLCTSPANEECSPDDSFSAYYACPIYLCQM